MYGKYWRETFGDDAFDSVFAHVGPEFVFDRRLIHIDVPSVGGAAKMLSFAQEET